MASVMRHHRRRRVILASQRRKREALAVVTIRAILIPGDETGEGRLIEAVADPWYEIIKALLAHPDSAHEIPWRKWEEIVAGAWRQEGFEVKLTPASGDGGKDIIATRDGVGSIRILDQVKAYKPGHLVTADEVRALMHVVQSDPKASKGMVTTTSTFAPKVWEDPGIAPHLPTRLDLKPRDDLFAWLEDLSKRKSE